MFSRCMLTMKKFLSLAVVAVLLVSTLAVVAFAAAPTTQDFYQNNGFYIYDGKSNNTQVKDTVEMTDTPTGLKVVHGGYYTSGDNCGGVFSGEMYDLDGFQATVYFEKVPEVQSSTDCWVAMDFLAMPSAFYTNNFDTSNGGNQGIMTLIRFSYPALQIYNGVTSFGLVSHTNNLEASQNAIFSITSGTTLTVKVSRTLNGTYQLTFARPGFTDLLIPWEFDMSEALPDGKAYFTVIPSCEIGGEDAFVYYITDIQNGKELTAESIAAAEAEKARLELEAKIADATKKINNAVNNIEEIKANVVASEDDVALGKFEAANAALEAAKAALAENNFDEVNAQTLLVDDLVYEAKKAAKDALKNKPVEEEPVEKTEEPVEKTEEPTNEKEDPAVSVDKTEDPAKEGGFPVVPVVIVVVVVVAAIAVALAMKKKK